MNIFLNPIQIENEINRIIEFLRTSLSPGYPAVIAVSGGLDSDVTARLTCRAVGIGRVKMFIVLQRDMESRHIENARRLAADLQTELVELSLEQIPMEIISSMAAADAAARFRPDGLLDPNRMKCSLRTAIVSTYQDRGYVVIGASNRTELETGFFLPFGDGIWHLGPIVHLYKTQVRQLAQVLGVRPEVLDQPASAGFWPGEEDLEDLAFWLCNGGPIAEERNFTDEELEEVRRIRALLSTEGLDSALLSISNGNTEKTTSEYSKLPLDVVGRLNLLTEEAKTRKLRRMGQRLDSIL
jgi:NAD+ synthase